MMKVAIIGAGAAGLFAAGMLTEANIPFTLFEGGKKAGHKLSITGKGRCNLTNNCDIREFLENVQTNSRFLSSAASAFSPADTMELFERLGVGLKTERGNRVFPVSDKAADIVSALEKYAGIRPRFERVKKITAEDGKVTGLTTSGGEYDFDTLLLATGGLSYPGTGSRGDGHRMARELGHTVTPLSPSLVPLVCSGGDCPAMMGLSLKNVSVSVADNNGKEVYSDFGEMLFTHFGVSGPVILSASAHMKVGERYTLNIDLKPALDEKTLDARILRDFSEFKNRDFANSLDALLPKKMIPIVIKRSGIPADTKVNSVTREMRRSLVSVIKRFSLDVTGFRPIDEAIITSGGVNVKEVNPKTMESKLISGLYFAGELLDLDAYTGGFNLQIAFSTAAAAARAITEGFSPA